MSIQNNIGYCQAFGMGEKYHSYGRSWLRPQDPRTRKDAGLVIVGWIRQTELRNFLEKLFLGFVRVRHRVAPCIKKRYFCFRLTPRRLATLREALASEAPYVVADAGGWQMNLKR